MALILHITSRSHWQKAQQDGVYCADSLEAEGFIHCSTPSQVVATANAYFHGQTGLMLLCLESDRVQSELRYETLHGSEYPHLHGVLNLDAVTQAIDFEPNTDGSFTLPPVVIAQNAQD
ncbi:DUF952 domain-containing protein [Stenomitos frigidus]|uniref:DUF952 domain-containing protein n=1 Tax=Stenomitos frigidus ULC18 TaxID=2107698 RepID=A0A2T1ESH8_9CYAN|nr:DUF952 domain-containing protein [Stenomitos frigidus]PSB35661.1 DUF952 domain-containing protein [Stenomitos frigidus ULC18]